jgi:arsenate reductase
MMRANRPARYAGIAPPPATSGESPVKCQILSNRPAPMITIYHNPRCSKSRGACELVNDRLNQTGEPVKVIEYLKESLSIDELKALHKMLGGSVRDMIRDNEAAYQDLGLGDQSLSDDQLYDAIQSNPILLQRPIVVRNGRAVIGRPPENVEALFA